MKEKALGWHMQPKVQEKTIIRSSCDSNLKKERIEELIWLILKKIVCFSPRFEKDIRQNKKLTWLILPKKKLLL